MKKRESILNVFFSYPHLICLGIHSMSITFKIYLNPTQQLLTISIAISIVQPHSLCLELNYWNSHRMGLHVSTLDPPCKVYFYVRAGMILWKHCHNKSPFNGSLFHSEEKLKSLQWLTKPYIICLLPSTPSYSSQDSYSPQLPPLQETGHLALL